MIWGALKQPVFHPVAIPFVFRRAGIVLSRDFHKRKNNSLKNKAAIKGGFEKLFFEPLNIQISYLSVRL